jgi:hypothetical protein
MRAACLTRFNVCSCSTGFIPYARTNGLCITLCDKAFPGAGWLSIVSRFALFSMQSFAAFAVLSGMLTVLGWSFVAGPQAPDNHQAYAQCIKHHPERYCRSAYMPSTLADKQR